MDEITLLIQTLTEYLAQLMKGPSIIDIIVRYVVPIIQLIAIVAGGCFALRKYRFEKNKEAYEKY